MNVAQALVNLTVMLSCLFAAVMTLVRTWRRVTH